MTTFIDNHTYCACGEKVKPGEHHECEDLGTYEIPTNKYYCVWCKSYALPKAYKNTTKCSNCGSILHGCVSNPVKLVMHNPLAFMNNNYSNHYHPNYDTYSNRFIGNMPWS